MTYLRPDQPEGWAGVRPSPIAVIARVTAAVMMVSACQAPEPAQVARTSDDPVSASIPESATDPELQFPDEGTTGVPAGVTLTPSDSLTLTEDGTVIDGLHVKGEIIITADNVTVRNTLVQTGTGLYPIRVERGTSGALIENVEVDNMGSTGLGIFLSGSGTVRNANIHSAEDGVRIQSDDVTIENSYIHDLHRQPGGHHDSIQIRNGDNITIRGNNLQAYVVPTDDPMNAAIQLGSLLGDDMISNLVVTGNLMNGGNYTINGGQGILDSALYADNHFGRDFRYGVITSLSDHAVWEDTNVWHDTGESVQ